MRGRRLYCDGQGKFYTDKTFTAGVGNLQETQPGDYWHADDAVSTEWVEFCSVCGMERPDSWVK